MVAKLYREQYGISLPLYPKQRMDAEITARNVSGKNEVNMDMIFLKRKKYIWQFTLNVFSHILKYKR